METKNRKRLNSCIKKLAINLAISVAITIAAVLIVNNSFRENIKVRLGDYIATQTIFAYADTSKEYIAGAYLYSHFYPPKEFDSVLESKSGCQKVHIEFRKIQNTWKPIGDYWLECPDNRDSFQVYEGGINTIFWKRNDSLIFYFKSEPLPYSNERNHIIFENDLGSSKAIQIKPKRGVILYSRLNDQYVKTGEFGKLYKMRKSEFNALVSGDEKKIEKYGYKRIKERKFEPNYSIAAKFVYAAISSIFHTNSLSQRYSEDFYHRFEF